MSETPKPLKPELTNDFKDKMVTDLKLLVKPANFDQVEYGNEIIHRNALSFMHDFGFTFKDEEVQQNRHLFYVLREWAFIQNGLTEEPVGTRGSLQDLRQNLFQILQENPAIAELPQTKKIKKIMNLVE